MTALTAPAVIGVGGRPRLADLAWNTVRQHRLALIGLAIVFAGFGVRLVLAGIPLHATYSQYLLHHCATQRSATCGRLLTEMEIYASWVTRYGGMIVLPGLIGVFIGAPLAARDFETGAYRFGLTQGVSGRRQITIKLLVIGTIVVIGSCLLSLLAMWCMAPFRSMPLLSQQGNTARPGRVTEFVSNPSGLPGPHGRWQVSGWFTGPGGQRLPWTTVQPILDRMPVPTAISPDRLRTWLATRHITYWIGYQPAGRYWLFQAAAAVILITLAAAAGFLAIRLISRQA